MTRMPWPLPQGAQADAFLQPQPTPQGKVRYDYGCKSGSGIGPFHFPFCASAHPSHWKLSAWWLCAALSVPAGPAPPTACLQERHEHPRHAPTPITDLAARRSVGLCRGKDMASGPALHCCAIGMPAKLVWSCAAEVVLKRKVPVVSQHSEYNGWPFRGSIRRPPCFSSKSARTQQ